jgi:hypothetical protein
MQETPNNSARGTDSSFTRRRFLAAGSASVVGLTAFGGQVAGQVSESPPYTVTLSGTIQDPLTAGDIKNARRRLKKKFRQKQPTTTIGEFSSPEVGDQYALVAYTCVIDSSGLTNQFFGTIKRRSEETESSPSSESSSAERDELVALSDTYRRAQAEQISTSDVEALAPAGYNTVNNDIGSDLQAENGFTHISSNKPWGKLGMYADIWSEPAPSEHWVVRQDIRVVPGVNISDWNDENQGRIGNSDKSDLRALHQWTFPYAKDGTVKSNTPNGPNNGETTVSATIGSGGAQVGYSYTVPDINRDDNSNFSDAKWNWNWNSGNSSTWRIKTGSRARFAHPDQVSSFHPNLESHVRFWRSTGIIGTETDDIFSRDSIGLK